MGEEHVAPYSEKVARANVREGNFRDYDGNEIGTVENLVAEFTDAFYQINMWVSGRMAGTRIKDTVNNYKAIRYCYNHDTHGMDDKINEELRHYSCTFGVKI